MIVQTTIRVGAGKPSGDRFYLRIVGPGKADNLLLPEETKQFVRVGGMERRSLDVRFLAATNRDLVQEVAAGRFRQDLYYRLNGMTLLVPPLRDRPSEIMPLARMFLEELCEQMGRPVPELGAEAVSRLTAYRWPGNVRELRNAIERAMVLSVGETISAVHLPND